MALRIDYTYIESCIFEGARVLDLGCGNGLLLDRLARQKGVTGCGIDVAEEAVRECIRRGVPVYHGDMLEGMRMFEDGAFDFVILSQTLQQTLKPEEVVQEMLRVGRCAIISFPNFGHWRVRLKLLVSGRMPVTNLLPHQWYDTPNVHLLTIEDFHVFCRRRGLRIAESTYFAGASRRVPRGCANLVAATAAFVVTKESHSGPSEFDKEEQSSHDVSCRAADEVEAPELARES